MGFFSRLIEALRAKPLGYPVSGVTPPYSVTSTVSLSVEQARNLRYADFDRMTSFAPVLDYIAALAVSSASELSAGTTTTAYIKAERPQFLEECMAVITPKLEAIARDLLKYGDAYAEPLWSKQGELVDVQTYSPPEIYITVDEKGKLVDKVDRNGFPQAYQQRKDGRTVAGWRSWELVRFSLFPSDRELYSRSILDELREDYKKLELIEQSMAIARLTRAYPRRIHYVDLTGLAGEDRKQALQEYARQLARGRKKPNSLQQADIAEDLILPSGYTVGSDGKPLPLLTKTELEDPSSRAFGELADIEYLRGKLFSRIPASLVGVGGTQQELGAQELAFYRFVRHLQTRLFAGVEAILKLAQLERGLSDEFEIVLPRLELRQSWRFADAQFRYSMMVVNYYRYGLINKETALRLAFGLNAEEAADVTRGAEPITGKGDRQIDAALGGA